MCEFNTWNPEIGSKKQPLLFPAVEFAPKDCHFLQVDASVFKEGFASYGCILKKHSLEIILVASRREFISIKPVVAEMLAIR